MLWQLHKLQRLHKAICSVLSAGTCLKSMNSRLVFQECVRHRQSHTVSKQPQPIALWKPDEQHGTTSSLREVGGSTHMLCVSCFVSSSP